ncbi:MAG: hypothetical protein HeimC3_54260 [Candidatus Heimdallarchaeota archaeon LC_3]|nr:MAG: hypothetical protein HeimC3_54260 [Candidatus Heimdallarchaeota archaeon LC_3]
MDPLTTYLLLVIIGFFIGIISAMVGIGGGLLSVPILMFLFEQPQNIASAISTTVIIFTSSMGAYTYFKQKRIDLRTGAYFAILAIPSAFIGGIIADTLDEAYLVLIFGILMILVAIRKILSETLNKSQKTEEKIMKQPLEVSTSYSMIPKSIEDRVIIDSSGEKFHYKVKLHRALIGALVGGFIGGLLGVGGGVIFVPVLTSIGNLPAHVGVATSTFTIMFSSSAAFFARVIGGNILYDYVVALAIGTVIGARLGALKVKKISSKTLLNIFYFVVIFAGIRTIYQALEALYFF